MTWLTIIALAAFDALLFLALLGSTRERMDLERRVLALEGRVSELRALARAHKGIESVMTAMNADAIRRASMRN